MRALSTSMLAVSLLCLAATAHAQVDTPAPVSNTMPSNNFGFNLPTHLGTLSYSLSGSEMFETGTGDGSVYASTALSGNLAYMSKSEQNPFSLVYSGGVLFTTVPGNSSAEPFQNLAFSQVMRTKSWTFVASDAVSYLPGSPTTGLSGVAGVGDIGTTPVQTGIGPAQDILTNYSSRISNGLTGSATWQTTARVDLEASGSWDILHYVGGEPGLDTDNYNFSVGPNYRIDALNSLGASALYSNFYYPGYGNYSIKTEGATINYDRTWTRRLSTTVSLGPARTYGYTIVPIPSQWYVSGSAGLTYATRTTGLYVNYSRGVNGGSGVLFGALSDSVSAGMNRPINRDWIFSSQLGFSRSKGLTPIDGVTSTYDGVFGSAQASRRLTESLSAYGSYTAITQSSQNGPGYPNAAFNGLNNIFSIGITFAPAPLISGR
jgi:hypothetical protein